MPNTSSWLALLGALLVVSSANAQTPLPAVRARFTLQSGGHTEHLELVRDGGRVEYRFLERGYSELWRRDARGELEHVRAYPNVKKSVHYTAGDLRTINLDADWTSLSSLLSRDELAALSKTGAPRSRLGHQAQPLRGPLRGKSARVDWLGDVQLPALLQLGEGKSKVVVSLVELVVCNAELCAETSQDDIRSLEFADLGDMEYDPFVRRYLARDALLLGHAAHVH